MTAEGIKKINSEFTKSSPEETLEFFLKEFKGRIGLASSLGLEDQVLTHMISEIDPATKIFTLDTGRLFLETYELISKTEEKYNINIQIYFPDAAKVEDMVNKKGVNLFYESVENRKLCCHIRKIESLKRAFSDLDLWICGLRSEQSVTRINTKLLEWDEANGLLKLNPLVNWNYKEVMDYIRKFDVPYNPLHDKGFLSIGCQPCTRAVEDGEDERSGRWWWEKPESKECGLHNRPQN